MTKKHFELFAKTIKNQLMLDRPWDHIPLGTQQTAIMTVAIVCEVAHESNPRFDETRFRRACGVPA